VTAKAGYPDGENRVIGSSGILPFLSPKAVMRLSWNEIRARAAHFSAEWKDAHYERGEAQSFYNDFFDIFGVKRRKVASFEEPVRKLGDRRGFIDLFWKGLLLVEHKSAGRSLIPAKQQALDYFPTLKDYELPRYILLSDFQSFELYDLEDGIELCFTLADLPHKIEAFAFILGVQKRTFRDQDPVNIEAAEIMGRLHDALEASGFTGDDLERFLVRLLFCLFADDTGIFEPRGIFEDLIKNRTTEDGSDLGGWLGTVFQTLDKPLDQRPPMLDADVAQLPYVNGDLFKGRIELAFFDTKMRRLLIEACEFNWERISPAIFGSLFQSILTPRERRTQGAHYTTEKNILKVIEPLFLEELRDEFAKLKVHRGTRKISEMKLFQQRLGRLRFLDPASGCGNFLVIAYREIRALEIDVLKEIYTGDQLEMAALVSAVDVDQFYGIEINESGARIAEVALWMMDHIMNNRMTLEFARVYSRIPLRKSPHIHHADALEIDWADVLPPEQCSYVLGNPPFVGAKYQTELQRAQTRRVANLGGSGGTLDYVTAWFITAADYIQRGKAKIGFVATNSITQGEQVAQLWPELFKRGLEISFAHRTFAWQSEARGKAHVHCVIIGLTKADDQPPQKRLFSYPDIKGDPVESQHAALTAYGFAAASPEVRHLVVRETSRPLNDAPPMIIGSKPIDGGYLIFDTQAECDEFLRQEPSAKNYVRPFIGSWEYINRGCRWILALQSLSPDQIRAMPYIFDRVKSVRQYRLGQIAPKKKPEQQPKSPGISSRALAEKPTEFHVTVIPDKPFLVVPKVSSELRHYVPIGWLEPPTIPSDLVFVLKDATPWHFGVLTSSMHMAWLRHIGGRLKSDFRYSIGLVYNTFPWPKADDAAQGKIAALAQAVLDARTQFPASTLADLYDPFVMPPPLRKAHRALDKAVDRLYRREPFGSDRERAEHLFTLYEKLIKASQEAASKKPARR